MSGDTVVNAFSVDVEEYFQVAAFDSVVSRDDWDKLPSRVVSSTERILGVLDKHGVRGTFFVLGWIAERHPALVRKISDAGHEIGCHGYSHQRVYRQERDTFRRETRAAKSRLEDCIGQAVVGYRAASFSITNETLWALDELVEAGFLYDSSVFPVHHDNYGIPSAKTGPSMLRTVGGAEIVEFPMSTVKILGLRIPVAGGGYFRLYPYWVTRNSLRIMNSSGRCCNFYCHPWEIDTEQPYFREAGWLSRFRHYNNLKRFEYRLSRLLGDFTFSSCLDVLRAKQLVD